MTKSFMDPDSCIWCAYVDGVMEPDACYADEERGIVFTSHPIPGRYGMRQGKVEVRPYLNRAVAPAHASTATTVCPHCGLPQEADAVRCVGCQRLIG